MLVLSSEKLMIQAFSMTFKGLILQEKNNGHFSVV